MKIIIFLTILFTSVLSGAYCDDGHGFTFNLGLGSEPITGYPSDIGSTLSTLRALPGVSETDINLNLDLGWYMGGLPYKDLFGNSGVTNYWLVVGIDGYAERFEDYSGSFQINNYVFGLGIQMVQGNFYDRIEVGPAVAVAQLSTSEISASARSDTGLGLSYELGWDFNPHGFGLLLGVAGSLSDISGSLYSGLGIAAALTYL